MGTLYLMRHGETDYHAQQRVLGRIDAGLNARGEEQARLASGFFSEVELDAIYTSPLRRCMETARHVAEAMGLELRVEEGLMEVDMGEWDGQLLRDLFQREPELVGQWMRNPSTVPIPGGEDFNAVRERVMASIEAVTDDHKGKGKVLLVSHGGPIRGILCEALGMDLDNMLRIQIDLTSISAVRYFEAGFRETSIVTLLNDTCHLR